ncbi:MAG TPA: hypothetical protein IAA29_07095 [Candidatus Paenibacillus intestinavium]|nr:hypothetical protein [Candidatus Paenibacillus intestinavium]
MLYIIIILMLLIIIIIGIGCWSALKLQLTHTKDLELAIYRLIDITKEQKQL